MSLSNACANSCHPSGNWTTIPNEFLVAVAQARYGTATTLATVGTRYYHLRVHVRYLGT